MSDAHWMKNELLRGAAVTVGASATNSVVSNAFRISSPASLYFRAAVVCSGVTSTTGITAKLQHSYDGGTTWVDVGNRAQKTITTNGAAEIRLVVNDSSDAAQLPLYPYGRVVVTTGTGDAVTVDAVYVVHR